MKLDATNVFFGDSGSNIFKLYSKYLLKHQTCIEIEHQQNILNECQGFIKTSAQASQL